MAKILIKNGRVWDGEKFRSADVLTDGDIIAKIEKTISEPADFVYDATDKILSAGLVDLHVHMKGIASDAFGIQPEMSSLPFGVTAVNDAGSVHGNRALLDAFSVKNTVFVGSKIKENHVDFAYSEQLLRKYGDKAIGVKLYFDTTLEEVYDITPLKELCGFAARNGLKVMVHCSHSPTAMAEITASLSAGDILTHIYHGGENACAEQDYAAFKIARKRGVILDAGFAGYVHTDFANLKQAIKQGFLPDTVSTDITRLSAYQRGGRYGMTLCMNLAKTAGMSEEALFRAVTAAPAEALNKATEWGFLKEGRAADLAVFAFTDEGFDLTDHAGNQINSKQGYRCVLTVLDGQLVYRD